MRVINIDFDKKSEKDVNGNRIIQFIFKSEKDMKRGSKVIHDVVSAYETDPVFRSSSIKLLEDPDEYDSKKYYLTIEDTRTL